MELVVVGVGEREWLRLAGEQSLLGRALNTRLRGWLGPYPAGGGTTFPPAFSVTPGKVGEETSATNNLATASARLV